MFRNVSALLKPDWQDLSYLLPQADRPLDSQDSNCMYAPLVTKQVTDMTEAECVAPESRRHLEKNKDTVHDPKDGSVSVSAGEEDWATGLMEPNEWKGCTRNVCQNYI